MYFKKPSVFKDQMWSPNRALAVSSNTKVMSFLKQCPLIDVIAVTDKYNKRFGDL